MTQTQVMFFAVLGGILVYEVLGKIEDRISAWLCERRRWKSTRPGLAIMALDIKDDSRRRVCNHLIRKIKCRDSHETARIVLQIHLDSEQRSAESPKKAIEGYL